MRSGLSDDEAGVAETPPLELQVGQYRTVTDKPTQGIVLAFTVRNPNEVPVRVLDAGGPVSGLTPAPAAGGGAGNLPDGAPLVVPGVVEIAPGALAELAVGYGVAECGNVAQGPAPLLVRVEVGDAPARDFFLPTPLLASPSAGSRGEGERRPWHEVLAAQVCGAER